MGHSGEFCCGHWFRSFGVYVQSLHSKAIKWLTGGINTVSSPDIGEINPITLAQITLWSYLMTSTMNDYGCFYSNALSEIHFWLPYQILTVSTDGTFHSVFWGWVFLLLSHWLPLLHYLCIISLFIFSVTATQTLKKLLWHFLKAGKFLSMLMRSLWLSSFYRMGSWKSDVAKCFVWKKDACVDAKLSLTILYFLLCLYTQQFAEARRCVYVSGWNPFLKEVWAAGLQVSSQKRQHYELQHLSSHC